MNGNGVTGRESTGMRPKASLVEHSGIEVEAAEHFWKSAATPWASRAKRESGTGAGGRGTSGKVCLLIKLRAGIRGEEVLSR